MPAAQKRACCSGPPPKLVYIRVRGSPVGLVGIEEIFERLYKAGREEDDALEQELVEQARIYNYIAPGSERDYGWGLRMAYRAFVASKKKGDMRMWLPFTRP
ncbi:MAG: hypothetical protein ACP5SI_07280 [Chloroflexia bacterium]